MNQKYLAKFITFWICICFLSSTTTAQQIVFPDGEPIFSRVCYIDSNYQIMGNPDGGTFEGLGITQDDQGDWFFNPARATDTFTARTGNKQIAISYTVNGRTRKHSVTVWMPLEFENPLEDQETCDGYFSVDVRVNFSGNISYRWEPEGIIKFIDEGDAIGYGYVEKTTLFYFIVMDSNSFCSTADTMLVTRHPDVALTTDPSEILEYPHVPIRLNATGGCDSFAWTPEKWIDDPSLSSPTVKPEKNTIYRVVGYNSETTCMDTAYVNVKIREEFIIPNAFTPTGDGMNDIFKIPNFGYQKVIDFRVFNRGGEEVFTTINGLDGWDGTHKGEPAPLGTYYYLIKLIDANNLELEYKGDVILLR